MPDINRNTPNERTFVYENSPFQIKRTVGEDDFYDPILLIKNWNFTPNMSDFDLDRIDTAAPIYTKKSDVLGTFQFDTVNTVDFYNPGSALDPGRYAYWGLEIAKGKPPSITILITMDAPDFDETPNEPGSKVNIEFIGRVMSCPQNRNQDTGVHTFTVNGEITSIEKIDRPDAP